MNVINHHYEESSIISNVEKFNQITEEYKKITEQAKTIIDRNLDNEKYREKLTKNIDYRVVGSLFDTDTTFFRESKNLATYQTELKSSILDKINRENYTFEKRKLKLLLENYKEELEEEAEYLEIKNIGTTLNTLREFYSDLNASLLRIQFSQVSKISKKDRYEQFVYELVKLDSTENEQINYSLDLNNLIHIAQEDNNEDSKG